VRFSGHAIECRINAEDPRQGFLPAPGTIGAYREPAGPGVRVDSGVTEGSEIVGLYDPLVAKLVVWDSDRDRARRRMLRALDEYVIEGVTTLLGFHRALLEHPCFVAGDTCFGLVETIAEQAPEPPPGRTAASGRAQEQIVGVELDGRRFEVALLRPEPPHAELARRRRERTRDGAHHAAAREAVVSPMQGTVLAVEVEDGDEVREGQVVCVVEAMKMENEITAHRPGTVTGLSVAEGEQVATGQVICVVAQEGERVTDEPL
jgi:acetyl-CoA/propionyl-CoA carboxylase biotin carboxyl carrier protein